MYVFETDRIPELIAPGGVRGSAMSDKCPKCVGEMQIVRREPHPARREYERQTLECSKCDYSTKRTVDEAGRPLR
jgi:uncharacterized protein with PIN domain